MTDLDEQFRTLDRLDAPDLWPEAERRQPGTKPPVRRHRLAATVLALAVAVAGVAFVIRSFGGSSPGPGPRPAAQAESGRIAFASFANGHWQIFSVDARGRDLIQLTDLPTDQFHPAWSPDGMRIAFSAQGEDGVMQIWVMDASGGNLERLTHGPGWNYLPQWSPDGTWIAFVSTRDGNDEIYVMNADGTEQTRLTDDADEDLSPAWSPDGSQIAFQSNRAGNNDIYVMNGDGSQVTSLTNTPTSGEFEPVWSPDGTRIAFASDRGANPEIYVMDENGSSVSRVTRDAAHDWNPAWSPDGAAIVFESDRAGTVGLYVLNLDRGRTSELIDGADACCPAWQPFVARGTSPSPGVATTRCTQATTSGDFDGDGTVDEAAVIAVVPAEVSCGQNGEVYARMESQRIEVGFGSGQTLDQALTDCQPCLTGSLVFAATDLDGDGRAELAIDVGPGAATDYVEFFRVDPSEMRPLVVSEPDDLPYVEPGPAIFGGGFDSGLWTPIECQVTPAGTRQLISVHAENLTGPITGPWRVHTTTMLLEGDRLVVRSTNEIESDNFTRTSDVFQNGCS